MHLPKGSQVAVATQVRAKLVLRKEMLINAGGDSEHKPDIYPPIDRNAFLILKAC